LPRETSCTHRSGTAAEIDMGELKESLTFRVSEVAEILQISEDKARRLMHGGWIRYIRIGREMRVTRAEMLRVLSTGTSPNP
jgi:excisionase family DNA binding protein